MNFGSSARIKHRDEVVEKERKTIEPVEDCRCLTEPNELLESEGGMLLTTCAGLKSGWTRSYG